MYVAPKPDRQDFSQWDKREDPKWPIQTDRLPAELVREVAGVAQASNGTFDHPGRDRRYCMWRNHWVTSTRPNGDWLPPTATTRSRPPSGF